ncbi:MAG TPA: hypothetical protein VK906_10070 [Egicoccus sp.]|nr:hypothetical protein [Egicoccus sp.]HSK23513.1 hypothetical protein [Egicoccus sp.]
MTVYVIGDVVDSRGHDDPAGVLAGVGVAVGELRRALSAAATVGDEFQALHPDLPSAVRDLAELRLRLAVDPPSNRPVRLRLGLGIVGGGPAPGDAGAPGQSDPGWWHARSALEVVAAPRRAWPPLAWWLDGEGDLAPGRAVLVALDSLAQRFDPIDMSLARGLLGGATARRLAADHGITPQSVGQRLHEHGIYGWVRTIETLGQEPA